MIYTASYAHPEHHHGTLVGISLILPSGSKYQHLRLLAPDKPLLQDYHAQRIDQVRYASRYRALLGDRWQQVSEWLRSLTPAEDLTLLCYEQPGEFCHRNMAFAMVCRHRPDCAGGRDTSLQVGDTVQAWNGFMHVPAIWYGERTDGRQRCTYASTGQEMAPAPILIRGNRG